MKKISRKASSFACALLLIILIVISLPAASMASGEVYSSGDPAADAANTILDILPYSTALGINVNKTAFTDISYVNVRFSTPYETAISWDFPYTDEFFSQPVNYYCHELARGSMGLAFAAFKNDSVNHEGSRDLKNYFDSIGFGDLEAEPYKHTPTANSVTYAIASKKIKDQTVIASVCCGAGYGKEWSSNLTVGDGERHEGFNQAAETVETAIYDYIQKYNISGKITLWTSGFSRASAVANIVAADMTDSSVIQKVYCYGFATPNTTKDGGNYTNIFNIIGKNDPIPVIPFADWGYTRYGTDLYTPTVEMDSDFSVKRELVMQKLREIDEHEYFYNPEVCYQIRTFFDYLATLLPEASDYSSDLQPGVLSVLANSKGGNILSLISRIISTFSPDTEEESKELSELMEYIEQLLNQYVLRGNSAQIRDGLWDPGLNVTQNLTTEHNPDKYAAWMFLSDDPEAIFGQNTQYRQFTVKGSVKTHLYDDHGYIETVNELGIISDDLSQDGEVRETGYQAPSLFTQHGDGQLNITIPSDRNYVLCIESDTDQDITYYSVTHRLSSVRSEISGIYTLHVTPGKEYYIFFGTDQGAWTDTINTGAAMQEAWSGSVLYSPSVILRLQNVNFLHLTFMEIIIALSGLLVFTYTELVVCVTLGLVRTFQGYQRRTIPTITTHSVNAALFLALEISLWYFVPAYPLLKLAAKLISFVFILSLSVVALTEYRSKRNLFLTLGISVFMLLSLIFEDALLPYVSIYSVSVKVLFYILLTVAAALTWIGHTRRRAFKIAEIEKKRHEKKIAKAERDMQRAYDKAERATQKYLKKQKKKAQSDK